MSPEDRARLVLQSLRGSCLALQDCSWMNPEDEEAVWRPFAEAIEAALAEDREATILMAEALEATYEVFVPDPQGRGRVGEIRSFADVLKNRLSTPAGHTEHRESG